MLNIRGLHPAWGGRKIRRVLERAGMGSLPSASTITQILHRHNLISAAASAQATPWTRFEREQPNELWQVDFKGEFKTSAGKWCYPLTMLDDHSRFSLGMYCCGNQRRATIKPHFREVFLRYGIPRTIYVDNGNPWSS